MTNKNERDRIRQARYVPGERFDEETQMTLKNLPKRKTQPLREKMVKASSIAAAVVLFMVFAAPPIVRAAAPIWQRLFGQVVEDIEQQQALPEDEKLQQMVADAESWSHSHSLEDTGVMLGDVQISVTDIRVMPLDGRDNPKGTLDLTLTFSKIPTFDPSWVDFEVELDGERLPMELDETFAMDYRALGRHTLTPEEWQDDISGSNSSLWDGVPTTYLSFPIDNWNWVEPRELALLATIEGQDVRIPVRFDPVKAHEEAVETAKISVALGEENYQHDKDELDAMRENALPVGLTGSAFDTDYVISEMSYAKGKLFFNVAFSDASPSDESPKMADMFYWMHDVLVDGMRMNGISSNNDQLDVGSYSTVYSVVLTRDPTKLPEESLISLAMNLGELENSVELAFRYDWQQKKATLAKDANEMAEWAKQSKELANGFEQQYDKDIYYDLTALDLRRTLDGITMRISGLNYDSWSDRMEIWLTYGGDVKNSPYRWSATPDAKVNGIQAYDAGSMLDMDNVVIKQYIYAPVHISEFGPGTKLALDFPLYLKSRDLSGTNYPTPDEVLHYEFEITEDMVPTLLTDDEMYLLDQ